MSKELIRFSNVKLAFGGELRLRIPELTVSQGERVLVLGHNGAGKTSLLNVAAGATSQSTGTIVRTQSLHYFGHQPMLYSSLTVSEHLEFWSKIFGIDFKFLTELAADWGLQKLSSRYPPQLSRGEQARVALVRTLASRAELLLLDEPTNALDLSFVTKLQNDLPKLNCAMMVSSHHIASSVFTRAIILKNGEVFRDVRDPRLFGAELRSHLSI